MGSITKRERIASQTLYQIGYKYLVDNFHKFKEAQKIRVAISILQIFEKDDSKTPPVGITVVFERDTVENNVQAPRFAAPSIQ